MSILDNIKILCEENNTNVFAVERELGFGRGTIRRWDTNSPSADKLEKVAYYFNVSMDWLVGKSNVREPIETEAFHQISLDGLEPEDVDYVKGLVERLRNK